PSYNQPSEIHNVADLIERAQQTIERVQRIIKRVQQTIEGATCLIPILNCKQTGPTGLNTERMEESID
ncbi:unnamed protein product, partial [Rotaria sordida]